MIKTFEQFNEQFYFNDWVDLDLLQSVIDKMKPTMNLSGDEFKKSIKLFNNNYTVNNERLPSTFGKRVADWVDLDIVQDIIDRMNPNANPLHVEYKKKLKNLIENGTY